LATGKRNVDESEHLAVRVIVGLPNGENGLRMAASLPAVRISGVMALKGMVDGPR
jgi:hypothetical protein